MRREWGEVKVKVNGMEMYHNQPYMQSPSPDHDSIVRFEAYSCFRYMMYAKLRQPKDTNFFPALDS